MSAPRPLRADRVVRPYGGTSRTPSPTKRSPHPSVRRKAQKNCHCEERSDAAIRFPARHRRADGTSYPKGICSAALHCRTPSPTKRDRTCRRAGSPHPAAQGNTDSHTSDIGHWFGMTGAWVYRHAEKRKPRWGFLFYFSLGIFHAVWSVWRRWWDFSPSGARRNSRYNACTSAFSWEKRTLVFLSMLQRISPR